MKTSKESNDKDRIIVIDNTFFPKGGANPKDDIIVEYISSTSYKMTYNLRFVSIGMGIVSLILVFIAGVLFYLGFKIKRDIKRKFLNIDEDDEEEEEIKKEEQEGKINWKIYF